MIFIFSNSIKELLRKLERKDANVFFVNISLPSERNNGLPRVLKYSYNAKTKNFEDDSSSLSNDTNDLQLVLFGSVYYSNLNRNYKFQLTGTISFSLFPSLKKYTLENIALLHSVMVILKTSLHWNSILGYHLALMVLIILWGWCY